MMKLDEQIISNAKPTKKLKKIFDGKGLYLGIYPSGYKVWRQKYRYGGKEKLLSHGPYPIISLKKARERCTEARRLLANDIDPSVLKKALKKLKRDMSDRDLKVHTDTYLYRNHLLQDDKLLELYIAAVKESFRKEAVSTAANKKKKKKKSGCLPGEAYPGQRKELKKRDEQIYKERISEGTTYRELGIKHGGLSGERVRHIVAKQARIESKREIWA